MLVSASDAVRMLARWLHSTPLPSRKSLIFHTLDLSQLPVLFSKTAKAQSCRSRFATKSAQRITANRGIAAVV